MEPTKAIKRPVQVFYSNHHLRCPECGSGQIRQNRGAKGAVVAYLKCVACGHTFKVPVANRAAVA